MQDKVKQLLDKINALSLRERILVLLACLVAMHQLWDSLYWIPLDKQQKALLASEEAINEQMLQQQVDLTVLSARANLDPDRQTREQLDKLKRQLESVRSQIESDSASLLSPAQMAELLEQMLIGEPELKLLSLETQEPTALISPSEDQSAISYQVYRHDFSIEFEGGYLPTLRYIEALEQLPWSFFWEAVDYRVEKYPNSRVRIDLYTFSLSEGWIGV